MTTHRPDTPSTRPLALVTGASNGIGLEIARELARRGHDLVVTGRSARTDEVADELRGLGVEAYPVRADLADYDAVEALWKAVLDLGRPLDVAVLNAGVAVGGAFADIDLADDLKLIDLNVKSVVQPLPARAGQSGPARSCSPTGTLTGYVRSATWTSSNRPNSVACSACPSSSRTSASPSGTSKRRSHSSPTSV